MSRIRRPHGAARHAEPSAPHLPPHFARAVDLVVLVPDALNLTAQRVVALGARRSACRVDPAAGDGGDTSTGRSAALLQIDSTPKRSRWSSMNATIAPTWSGGRAPPGRKTRTPSAESRSPASARDSRAPAPPAARARSSSARPLAGVTLRLPHPLAQRLGRACPASSPPPAAPPTPTGAPAAAPSPSGRRAHAPPVKTDSDVP